MVNRILIVRLSSLGDIVQCIPAVSGLRRCLPDSYIAWMVDERYAKFLSAYRDINEIIPIPGKELQIWIKHRHWGKVITIIRKVLHNLRNFKFDVAIDLHGQAKSAFWSSFSKVDKRIGYPRLRELSWIVSRPIGKYTKTQPWVELFQEPVRYICNLTNPEFTEIVDGINFPSRFCFTELNNLLILTHPSSPLPLMGEEIGEGVFKKGTESNNIVQLPEKNVYIGICPGGGIPQKLWGTEKYAELIFRLRNNFPNFPQNHQPQFILFGTEKERDLVYGIINQVNRLSKNKGANDYIHPIIDIDLTLLPSVINLCKIVIGSDTGPVHLAAILGKPIVTLYGPNDPQVTGPYTSQATVIYKKFTCSPCGIKPKCTDNQCMQTITVNEVYTAILQLLVNFKEN